MLGISTSYFAARRFSIYESVKKAHDLGFPLVELGANHDFEENIGETLKRIRQDFPETIFTQHCYFPPPFRQPFASNAGEGLTDKNKKVIEGMFTAAKIIKPQNCSFHCGTNRKYVFKGEFKDIKGFKKFAPAEEIPLAEAKNNLKDFFLEVVKRAKEKGIRVAVENMWCKTGETPLLKTPADFKDFLSEIPGLGILLDYSHATLNYPEPNDFFSLGGKIYEMHLSGIKNGRDHWSITESLNLLDLFSHIKKLKEEPLIILEHSGEVTEDEISTEKNLIEKALCKL
ncbi:TIM barrel protein [Candidatus Microgenomates bacterium]|nr:TIM barrel protein [Candidatus Microgenomates bacterium]